MNITFKIVSATSANNQMQMHPNDHILYNFIQMRKEISERQFLRTPATSSGMRQKLSLRNLLSLKQGGTTYFSLTADKRSMTNRPQTMNCQRVKNKLTEMDPGKTQLKLTQRGMSQYVSKQRDPSVSQSKQQKHRLKKVLGKVNIMADGITFAQQQQIEAIFDLLDSFGKIDNYYQKAFIFMRKKLWDCVYSSIQHFDRQTVANLASSTKLPVLISLYKGFGKVSYKQVARQMISQTQKMMNQMIQERQGQLKKEEKISNLSDEKNAIISKLTKKLAYFQEHPSQNLYKYIQKLQLSTEKYKSQARHHIQQIKSLQNHIQLLTQSNIMITERLDELKAKLYEYEMEEFSGLKQVQKNSQLKEFESNVGLLKHLLAQSVIRMEGMKGQFEQLQQYNDELITQRSKLAKRAAVGFGALTPRPNFHKIFEQNGMKYEQLINQDNSPSTEDIFIKIMSQFKKYYESHQQTHKADESHHKKPRKSKETIHVESDKIIDELGQAKQQIQKTMNSANEVKKAYNKQKNQKQELNKVHKK